MTTLTKACPNCGKVLPRDQFVALAGHASSRAKYCVQCQPLMRRGGARAFDFNEPVKREVIGRQQGLCASCGTSFSTSHSAFPNFHHVIPNQAGNPADPADAFLRESDNCVMLCDECHDSAHDSNTTSGGMAPPDFFLHSHGGDRVAHQAWAQQLAAQTPSRWR